jgi:hypothetical protein
MRPIIERDARRRQSAMSNWVQLTSINPAGPVWINLDASHYMAALANGTAIHFLGGGPGNTIAVKKSPREILDAASGQQPG